MTGVRLPFDLRHGNEVTKHSSAMQLHSATPDLQASQRRIDQLESSYKKVASEARAIEVELKAPSRVVLIQKAI